MTAELIEEFTDWLNERDAPDTAAFASHAEMFLDWRESAPLATLDDDGLREFLLGWCPRKLSMPAEESREVCEAVAEFVCFLGATGRLDGGPERARAMMRTVIGLTDTMTVRMADPANFGMAKSLFAGISGADRLSQEELAAALPPGARTIMYPDGGHFFPVTRTADFLRDLTAFADTLA